MEEKREYDRKNIVLKTIITKTLPSGEQKVMEFLSKDLSYGGVFILSEDLKIFELGEEIEIKVVDRNSEGYAGKASVIRSAMVFYKENEVTHSGFGLMFTNLDRPPKIK
ncbi:MAG: PilZ domain-containing protein [Spirochaetales bacterium]|nr:PilZ domain-containing protein [Spirochaetales bacterium]